MPNYQQTTIAGDSWIRASRVVIENPLEQVPQITFSQERVINLPDTKFTQGLGTITKFLSSDVYSNEFTIVNPITGEPTDQAMQYQQVYAILHQLFLHLANEEALRAVISIPEVIMPSMPEVPVVVSPEETAM